MIPSAYTLVAQISLSSLLVEGDRRMNWISVRNECLQRNRFSTNIIGFFEILDIQTYKHKALLLQFAFGFVDEQIALFLLREFLREQQKLAT